MTALAANVSREWREGVVADFPVQASSRIYQGSLVEIDANGRVAAHAKAQSKTIVGVAIAEADNSSGSAGDLSVRVQVQGAFRFAKTGTAVPGKTAYAADDNTVTDASSGASAFGRILSEEDGQVLVALTTYTVSGA